MIHQPHGESDMALEQEFEWVNAWPSAIRTGASAPSDGEAGAKPHANDARQGTGARDRAGAAHAVQPEARRTSNGVHARAAADLGIGPVELVSASRPDVTVATAAAATESTAAEQAQTESSPGGIVAQIAAADPIVRPDAGRGTGRWTSLFRLATRSQTAGSAAQLFVDAAPSQNERTPKSEARIAAQDITATVVPDQFARDIAEIQMVRDRLLAMPPAHEGRFRAFAVRTSDAAPILVGVVLAFTSLIVFAVAASFVSLR